MSAEEKFIEDGVPHPRRIVAIAALGLGTMVTVLDGGVANVALPTIARELDVAPSAAVLIVTVYQLVLVTMLLPCSGLGDRIGLRRFYQGGLMLFVVATLCAWLAPNLPLLLAARALQALGAAATLSMTSAMIRHIYPRRLWGRGLAGNAVIATFAAASAPTLGGLIVTFLDWRYVFVMGAPLAFLSVLVGWRALPDTEPFDSPFNLGGALLNVATFGLLFLSLQSFVHGGPLFVSIPVLVAGIGFAVWFVRYELKEDRPILPLDLLGNPVIALSSIAALFAYAASMLQTVALPFRLEHLYGFSAGEVGAILSPLPLSMTVSSPLAGMLSDRVPPGLLGALGMVVVAAGLVLNAYPPVHPSYFDLAWRMALCGVGLSFFLTPNARLLMSETPRERAAATGGLMQTTRLTAQTLGATAVAMLLAMHLGTSAIPLLLGAACALVSALFSLTRLRSSARA